jgi:hypothetical protein
MLIDEYPPDDLGCAPTDAGHYMNGSTLRDLVGFNKDPFQSNELSARTVSGPPGVPANRR